MALFDTFRLLIEENNGHSNYLVLAEFEILVGGVDITTGATATANSVVTSNTPNKTIDNNKNSHLTSRMSEAPILLQVVLLQAVDVNTIDSYSIQGWYYGSQASYAAKAFKFQFYDGTSWVTLNSQTEQTGWAKYEVRNYPITPPTFYEISATITESLSASEFNVRAYDFSTGNLVAETLSSDNTYTLAVGTKNLAAIVTCVADEGNVWLANTVYALNDKIIPNDPATIPYYYKCTQAGTTGTTEPVFPPIPGETVTDNNVIWECVERLVQPISQGPLIPQAVV